MNLSTKQKQTPRPVVATGEGVGGGMDGEFGISRCKLLYTCITESLCCTPETNTTLEINYTSTK